VQVIQPDHSSNITPSSDPVEDLPGPSDIREEEPTVHDERDSSAAEKPAQLTDQEREFAAVSVGVIKLLSLGALGYWTYRRYLGGVNGWRTMGIAVGIWAGIAGAGWLGVRYAVLSKGLTRIEDLRGGRLGRARSVAGLLLLSGYIWANGSFYSFGNVRSLHCARKHALLPSR
jgi:hypothetical protein